MVASSRELVTAAACQNVSDRGAITVQLPSLPSVGTYTIWTLMQIPDAAHNQYQLDVNNDSCYEVGGASVMPASWQWVSSQAGTTTGKVQYNFTSTSGNSMTLIGTQAGVRLDRILVTKNTCVPSGNGTNCQSDTVSAVAADLSGASTVPPPSDSPVSGSIVPSQTITNDPANVLSVIYVVDSVQIPAEPNFALDTTLLSNGTHQVVMRISKANGTISNEATTITVNNPQTAFAPFIRWIRLNQHTAVMVSSIVGGVLVFCTLILLVKHIRLQRRLLSFHGF